MHFLENFISIQTQEKTHLETPGGKHQKLSLQIIIPHSSLFPYQSSFLHNLIIFQTWHLPVHIPNCFWRLQCKQMKQRTLSYLIIATLPPWVTSEHCKSGLCIDFLCWPAQPSDPSTIRVASVIAFSVCLWVLCVCVLCYIFSNPTVV